MEICAAAAEEEGAGLRGVGLLFFVCWAENGWGEKS
jgi:hypothetical protein